MLCSEIRESIHMKLFDYCTKEYPFKKIIEDSFGVPLSDLHKWIGHFPVFNKDNDQQTIIHKVFYANFELKFQKVYEKFINNFLTEIIDHKFYYQKIPTFRIGLPGNKFVGEFHKDSQYNHQDYEINFNVGLSNYLGETALKVEAKPNSNEFVYLACPYGTIFSFDHINCLHGSELNTSDKTMVSFDFRIALKNFYFSSNAKSIGNATRFNKGYYFSDKVAEKFEKFN